MSTYEPHACVVVYSIVDRNSFRVAEEILNYLWSEHYTKEKAVIIAANKSDLARARVITTAGKRRRFGIRIRIRETRMTRLLCIPGEYRQYLLPS